MTVGKKRSALGNNPLQRGIFQQTEDSREKNLDSSKKKEEDLLKNEESSFLVDGEKEKVNLLLPIALNDWLDSLVKGGKRQHGQKIPKQIWMQAALELFRAMPMDWSQLDSVEALRYQLQSLETKFQNPDFD